MRRALANYLLNDRSHWYTPNGENDSQRCLCLGVETLQTRLQKKFSTNLSVEEVQELVQACQPGKRVLFFENLVSEEFESALSKLLGAKGCSWNDEA
mmetsp:Transcript_3277/g.4852  ORF Transcript_3277/g.4852 Transcript_3277/m.4852 type:complete len:97 (-) Transcript_3277:8-298(-)